MSDKKHTPLPWKVGKIRQCGTKIKPEPVEPVHTVDIFAPNGNGVYHKISNFTFTSEDEAEQRAYVGYIVKACNAYPELVEALKKQLYPMVIYPDGSGEVMVDPKTAKKDRKKAKALLTKLGKL